MPISRISVWLEWKTCHYSC